MTTLRISTVIAALALGVATIPSAMAFPERSPFARYMTLDDVETTGSIGSHVQPGYTGCPMSSAAEGNANQQNFPVKQYGQTSGGYRC